jgi:hypothetical protein
LPSGRHVAASRARDRLIVAAHAQAESPHGHPDTPSGRQGWRLRSRAVKRAVEKIGTSVADSLIQINATRGACISIRLRSRSALLLLWRPGEAGVTGAGARLRRPRVQQEIGPNRHRASEHG